MWDNIRMCLDWMVTNAISIRNIRTKHTHKLSTENKLSIRCVFRGGCFWEKNVFDQYIYIPKMLYRYLLCRHLVCHIHKLIWYCAWSCCIECLVWNCVTIYGDNDLFIRWSKDRYIVRHSYLETQKKKQKDELL